MEREIKPVFKNLIQVGMVVPDLQAAMDNYVYNYSLGLMYVLEFNSRNVANMSLYGETKNYSMDLGVCAIGDVRFELIKPISESIYSDYQNEYGNGIIHHLKLGVTDYYRVMEYFISLGIKVIQHGEQLGDKGKNIYSYLETRSVLGFIIEIVDISPDFVKPAPRLWYPENKNVLKNLLFKRVSKVGLIVKNLKTAIEKYESLFGMDPWIVKELNNKNYSDLHIYGKKRDYEARIGTFKLGNVKIVLTEPLTESIFTDFLEKYGENAVCYLGMEIDNYKDTLAFFNSRNIEVIQSGKYPDNSKYSYLSTSRDLNFIIEINEKNLVI